MIRTVMQLARPVLVVVLGLAALGACYGGSQKTPPGNQAQPGRHAVDPGDPLAYLPADAELVIGIDPQQVFASPLWKRFEPQIMKQIGGTLEELRRTCGFDPLERARQAAMGVKRGRPDETVAVLRGLDRDRSMDCLRRFPFQGGRKAVIDGAFVTPPVSDGNPPMILTFVDATTVVAYSGPQASRARLEAVIAAGAPLRRSPAFLELWSLVDTKQAMWLVANGSASMFDALAQLGARPTALLGSIHLATGVSASGRARFGSPDQATQLGAMAQGQLAMVKSMADVEVTVEGNDLKVRLDLTMAQIEMLAGLLGSFGGGNPLGGP